MGVFHEGSYDAVVVGAGHAGAEAALALARTGWNTLLITLNLDSISFLPCNPSIGGTAKAHLVREIDAMGGEMGLIADDSAIQVRMLNAGKGAAVQSLRAQVDKDKYHRLMKCVLERTERLHLLQTEVTEILTKNGRVTGVKTAYGSKIECRAVIVATGVYLGAQTIAGELVKKTGPNGFERATRLTKSLLSLGYRVRRFKTGTPARVDGRTIDYSVLERQDGETVFPFSFLHTKIPKAQSPCYVAYTNARTHEIIRNHLDRAPLFNGKILSVGPRYCPSIETKIVRFPQKERHQLFLEPEGTDSREVYVQGLSTSLPHDLQREVYRSIRGFEKCEIMRYAYAIEYDCIDTLDVLPTLESKRVKGLFTAGQINGTSGYEEAAAQGLMAGLNASLQLRGTPPLVLRRDQAYLGVLIDDLVTKGTDEPYRMMTSRAEFRLNLRQDNADLRLTEIGRACKLVTDRRYRTFCQRRREREKTLEILNGRADREIAGQIALSREEPEPKSAVLYSDLLRRGVPIEEIKEKFNILQNTPNDILLSAQTEIVYEGYLKRNEREMEKSKKLEDRPLPEDVDYEKILGLRLEAREKLNRIRPLNLGQAGRISGVSPADLSVLMIYLSTKH